MIHLGVIGTLIVVLVVVGVLLGLATTYIPMSPPIKQLLVAVVVIATVLWVLRTLGILASLGVLGAVIQVLIVVGVLLWVVTTFIPMSPPIKQILVAVVVIATALWCLQAFGFLDFLGSGHRAHGGHTRIR